MSKRPNRRDKEVIAIAAKELAPEVMKWFLTHGSSPKDMSIEDIEKELIEVLDNCYDDDGYKLAKEYDDKYSIDADAELVGILDGAGLYEAEEKAAKQWVKDNNIEPSFKLGDMVTFTDKFKPPVTGEIVAVDKEKAKYTIFCESLGHVKKGLGTTGRILNFEDVVAAT